MALVFTPASITFGNSRNQTLPLFLRMRKQQAAALHEEWIVQGDTPVSRTLTKLRPYQGSLIFMGHEVRGRREACSGRAGS